MSAWPSDEVLVSQVIRDDDGDGGDAVALRDLADSIVELHDVGCAAGHLATLPADGSLTAGAAGNEQDLTAQN